MSKLHRYYSPGNIYFVTTVTHNREPILLANIDLFNISLARTHTRLDFVNVAWVVLPDHVHFIIDPKNSSLSDIMKSLKQDFGYLYRQKLGTRKGKVWQRRFWDHVIRDQTDMNRHVNYIHHNPVKHGLATFSVEYQYSSFAEYVRNGYYDSNWKLFTDEYQGEDFGE